jgi:hypothetical protein
LGALAACAQPPVDWGAPYKPSVEDVVSAAVLPPVMPSLTRRQCPEALRTAHAGGTTFYAVTWALRPDNTANLVVLRSDDGRSWTDPVVVDTMDTERAACARPPASIAAEGDNVHVAYAMAAREGPGIFASHSMDRGRDRI